MAKIQDMDDVADVLGWDPTPKRRGGRPPKAETVGARQAAERVQRQLEDLTRARRAERFSESGPTIKALHPSDVQHGVTVGWLADVFQMDPATVRKRIKDCPPIATRKVGHVYDLKQVAQYLVTPVFDAEKYLKNMKASELPTHLSDAYWSAMNKKQKWEENAGHLWRTESVMEVFGDVFQTIKFAMQLWPDNVERAQGLNPEQRTMLIAMGDAMQNEIHKKLLQMPLLKRTEPIASEGMPPIAPDSDGMELI